MFHIALVHPDIPSNTGNIMRLASNTGVTLHLIHPLGFRLDNTLLKRAGLDYKEYAHVVEHNTYASFEQAMRHKRRFILTSKGDTHYHAVDYAPEDIFIFGSETGGLPNAIMKSLPKTAHLRIPMRPNNRCLNLANSVAIVVFEAWRQCGFAGSC